MEAVQLDEKALGKKLKAMLDEAYMAGYTVAKEEENQKRLLLNADILAKSMVNDGKCRFTMEQPGGDKAGYEVRLVGYSADGDEFADIS